MVISRPIRRGKTLVSLSNEQTLDTKLTIKQRIILFSKNKNTFLVSDFIKDKLNNSLSRRPIERSFRELTDTNHLKRVRCICGCSYIYSKI